MIPGLGISYPDDAGFMQIPRHDPQHPNGNRNIIAIGPTTRILRLPRPATRQRQRQRQRQREKEPEDLCPEKNPSSRCNGQIDLERKRSGQHMLSFDTRRGEIKTRSTPLTHNRQLKSKKQKRLARKGVFSAGIHDVPLTFLYRACEFQRPC